MTGKLFYAVLNCVKSDFRVWRVEMQYIREIELGNCMV